MPSTLTPEHIRRVEQAKAETQRLIDKEMGYSEDLRKPIYLQGLHDHLARLERMIEEKRFIYYGEA